MKWSGDIGSSSPLSTALSARAAFHRKSWNFEIDNSLLFSVLPCYGSQESVSSSRRHTSLATSCVSTGLYLTSWSFPAHQRRQRASSRVEFAGLKVHFKSAVISTVFQGFPYRFVLSVRMVRTRARQSFSVMNWFFFGADKLILEYPTRNLSSFTCRSTRANLISVVTCFAVQREEMFGPGYCLSDGGIGRFLSF